MDETQKIPAWSEQIKRLWDQDTAAKLPLRVLILGSAPLLMQKDLTESLTGRFKMLRLTHWSSFEMNAAFGWDLDRYIFFGGYPGAADLVEDEDRWKRYILDSMIETTLSRDLLQLNRVDKPALLRQLFSLGCSYSGRILSYTKIVGQLQDAGNTTTLAHYLELLDAAGMLTGLNKYAGQRIRQRGSSPKFVALNNAFIAAQSEYGFETARGTPACWGRLVESAVGAHIVNECRTRGLEVYYWREGSHCQSFSVARSRSGSHTDLAQPQTYRRIARDTMTRLHFLVILLPAISSAQWVRSDYTPAIHDFPVSMVVRDSTILMLTSMNNLYRSADNGSHWSSSGSINQSFGGFQLIEADSTLYAAEAGGIGISTDWGATWQIRDSGMTNPGTVSVTKQKGVLLAGTLGFGLFRSTDNGIRWTNVPSPAVGPDVQRFSSTSTDLYLSATVTGASRSTDQGSTWTVVNDTLFGPLASVDSLVLAAGAQGMFRSANSGKTWVESDSGLGSSARLVFNLFLENDTFFAGTFRRGLFASGDSGKTWKSVSVDHPTFYTNSMCALNGYLVVGDVDSGVWRRPLSEILTSAEAPSPAAPAGFELAQNYPNPFNPATTIRYALPAQSRVHLEVYNTLGQVVAELVNGDQPAGWNSVTWNPAIASGVYFCRLEAAPVTDPARRYVAVRKLITLK